MQSNKYFDFFVNDKYYSRIYKICNPYRIKDEIKAARLAIPSGCYGKAGTEGRWVLEHLLLKGFESKLDIQNKSILEQVVRKSNNSLEIRIDFLKKSKIINGGFQNKFHELRKIGNAAIHQMNTDKNRAIRALELSDLCIRYLIQEIIDKSYDYQLHIPEAQNDSIELSTVEEIEKNTQLIEKANQDLDKKKREDLEKKNESIKEEANKIDDTLSKMIKLANDLTAQIPDPNNLDGNAKKKFEKITDTTDILEETLAKQRATYDKARDIQKEILSETDWIYKVLQGKGTTTDKQDKAIKNTSNEYKINGSAGSGKSLVLLIKCLKEIDNENFKSVETGTKQEKLYEVSKNIGKKKAILFTYNKSLMNYLNNIVDGLKKSKNTSQEIIENIKQLNIKSFDNYIWTLGYEYGITSKLNPKDDYGKEVNKLIQDLSNRGDLPKFDIVAIDEAQDLSLEALGLIYKFRKKDDESKFYIVFDEAQKIYKRNFTGAKIDSQLNFRGRSIILDTNLRNHPNIAKFSEKVLDGEICSIADITTEYISENVVKVSRAEALAFRVKEDENVAYLFKTNKDEIQFSNELRTQGIEPLNIASNIISPGYFVGTIYSAKGLEFDNVFLVDFPTEPEKKNLRYVACSRARKKLAFVCN